MLPSFFQCVCVKLTIISCFRLNVKLKDFFLLFHSVYKESTHCLKNVCIMVEKAALYFVCNFDLAIFYLQIDFLVSCRHCFFLLSSCLLLAQIFYYRNLIFSNADWHLIQESRLLHSSIHFFVCFSFIPYHFLICSFHIYETCLCSVILLTLQTRTKFFKWSRAATWQHNLFSYFIFNISTSGTISNQSIM